MTEVPLTLTLVTQFEEWFESVVCVFGGLVNTVVGVVVNTNEVGILSQLPILITALEDPFETVGAIVSLVCTGIVKMVCF